MAGDGRFGPSPAPFARRWPLTEPMERLERRVLLSGTFGSLSATVGATPVPTLAVPAASAAATAPSLTAAYTGTAKLRPVGPHARAARHELTLDLTDSAGQLTGTATVADVGQFAVSGTLAGHKFTLTTADGTGQFVGKANKRGTRVAGKVPALVAGGLTYRGAYSAKAPAPPPAGNPGTGTGSTGTLPRPDHVVIVVEENHSYGQILGSQDLGLPGTIGLPEANALNRDDYIRQLASGGASFTNASAETHPSQPNYLALFSGSTQGVTSDAVPGQPLAGPDLGGELLAAGLTFAGYSEDLPAVGFTGDTSGDYARKHNPWSDFADVPASANLPFGQFPHSADGYANLPTVSFVVPNQQNDMHSGSVHAADQWLQQNLAGYAQWAQSHNSLLIVTWDEGSGGNQIPTIFSGQSIKPGQYAESVNHYRMLRTLEDMYGLPPTGRAAQVKPITDVFK